MPPRKKRIQPTKKILSSSSSSSSSGRISDPSYLIDDSQLELHPLTRSGKTPHLHPDSSNIFDLAEDSPMKSPAKFGDDLLLETPAKKKKVVKLPVLSPLKNQQSPTQTEKKDALFFKEYRTFNFLSNKTERSLLIFELSDKLESSAYNYHKLIASLYHITSIDNQEQLKWLQANVDQIANFENYEDFFKWFKDEVPYKRLIIPKRYEPLAKIFLLGGRWIVQQFINLSMALLLVSVLFGALIFLLIRLGYVNEEVQLYFQVVCILFYLMLDSFRKPSI